MLIAIYDLLFLEMLAVYMLILTIPSILQVHNSSWPVWSVNSNHFTLLQWNSLYRAVDFANFEGILGFPVLSIILADLLGNMCCMSSKGHGLWFLIGGFRFVLFVLCFKVNCIVIVLF